MWKNNDFLNKKSFLYHNADLNCEVSYILLNFYLVKL